MPERSDLKDCDLTPFHRREVQTVHNMASCMLSILDSLKLYDLGQLELGDETLSEMMFRKMEAYKVDLNKELEFTHLKPIKNKSL